MKTHIHKHFRTLAGTLLVTLVICSILSFSVLGYLSLVEHQNLLGSRSQAWNMAIAVVEAGVEEGLQHLNANYDNLTADGWAVNGTIYSRTNTLSGGNSYYVSINTASGKPEILCQAYVLAPSTVAQCANGPIFAAFGTRSSSLISRKVRVRCSRGSLFLAAMVAKDTIDMNGNGIRTDSFDSGNPKYSTDGQYDPNPSKVRDGGDVASNLGIVNAVDVANANIYGKAHTGPGGSVSIGPNGGIGSRQWQLSHDGIEPGWFTADANFTFPDTRLPDPTGYLELPNPGTLVEISDSGTRTTNYYDNILYDGYNYKADSLSGKTIVVGKAKLLLKDGLSISGGNSLKIAKPGSIWNHEEWAGSVTVHCGGSTIDLRGQDRINSPGLAANLILYAAPTVTSISLNGNAKFTGVLVAPSVNLTMNGGGKDIIDFSGAVMVGSVTMNGHFSFHYDEALGRMGDNGRFLVDSWDEVSVN